MEELALLFENAGLLVYVVIGLVLVLLGWWGFKLIRGREKRRGGGLPAAESYETVSKKIKKPDAEVGVAPPCIILGEGDIKCLCFRKVKSVIVADFTYISEPIGELYQFDPSCPISGNGYIVKQLDDGTIVDYDPREVKVKENETPDYAWDAINWKDDVNNFWTVPVKWWRNVANWYAAGVLGLCFLGILVVLG